MHINNHPLDDKGNPEKAYSDEMENKGSTLTDSASESVARDRAKVEKVQTGETQKMDGIPPDELNDDGDLDEEIRRETLENK